MVVGCRWDACQRRVKAAPRSAKRFVVGFFGAHGVQKMVMAGTPDRAFALERFAAGRACARTGRPRCGRWKFVFGKTDKSGRDRPVVSSPGPTQVVPAASAAVDSDLLLVERTVAGDQRAFELLVIKYQRRIQRLIGRMVRDVDLVEDIAQETFIRAYRALHQFRGDAQFYTWLYRIAVNTAKKTLMELKHDPTVSESSFKSADDEDETSRPRNEPTSDETPESVLAAKEIGAVVNAAMEALPEDLRQAVTLREIEGLTYEEIAVMMSCPIGTVRSRIFRAREAISAKIRPMLESQIGKRW
jgi:RNA polymerase sigma-70 factor (ECF subfamily)